MSQKTDNMIKLALVFFVTLLSFSIGTYVGKKYSDNQHKLSLLEPKKNVPTPKAGEFASDSSLPNKVHGLSDDEQNSTEAQHDSPPAALTDSEVAKIAEEFATEETATEEKLVATINPHEKELKVVAENTVKNPTPHQTAVQKTEETRVPASLHPTPANSTATVNPNNGLNPKKELTSILFTVQVGSYPNQSEAEKITQDLLAKGFKTSFVPAKVNGQVWYRVNVGLFGTIKEAQDYKKEFLEKTKLSSAIVQRVLQ